MGENPILIFGIGDGDVFDVMSSLEAWLWSSFPVLDVYWCWCILAATMTTSGEVGASVLLWCYIGALGSAGLTVGGGGPFRSHAEVFVSLELRSTVSHDGWPCLGEVEAAASRARDELGNDDAKRACSLGIVRVR